MKCLQKMDTNDFKAKPLTYIGKNYPTPPQEIAHYIKKNSAQALAPLLNTLINEELQF